MTPELAVTGYSAGERFYALAEPWPDGDSLRVLSALAQELEVVLVAGFAEASTTRGLIYDSAAVFERNGRPIASCRKSHCLDTERRYFTNGDELPRISTSLGRLGLMICWDAAFPEVARTHALTGADLFVTIGAWEDPYVRDWELVAAARAYDNVTPLWRLTASGLTATSPSPATPGSWTVSGRPWSSLAQNKTGCSLAPSISKVHGR